MLDAKHQDVKCLPLREAAVLVDKPAGDLYLAGMKDVQFDLAHASVLFRPPVQHRLDVRQSERLFTRHPQQQYKPDEQAADRRQRIHHLEAMAEDL